MLNNVNETQKYTALNATPTEKYALKKEADFSKLCFISRW